MRLNLLLDQSVVTYKEGAINPLTPHVHHSILPTKEALSTVTEY